MEKTINKTCLVKIDSKLYEEAVKIAKAKPIDYPSVKNFIETAVRSQINVVKYSFAKESGISLKADLLSVSSNKGFSQCMICNNVFMSSKQGSKEEKNICPRCKTNIIGLAEKLKGQVN